MEPVAAADSSEMMSPKRLPVHITSNWPVEDHLHGRVVHVHVRELDLGVLGGEGAIVAAPDHHGLKHVGLVDADELLLALHGRLESDAVDATKPSPSLQAPSPMPTPFSILRGSPK